MRILPAPLTTHLAGNAFLVGDLYEITVRGTTYYLTDRESDISWDSGGGAHTYTSTVITKTRVRQGSDGTIDDLTVTVAHGGALTLGGVAWAVRALNGDLKGALLKVWRAYFSSATTVVGAILVAAGNVGPMEPTSSELRLTVRPFGAYLDGTVPRHVFSATCTWALYDQGCGLTRPTTWDAATTAAGGSSTLVKVASVTQATDFFRAGRVEFTSGALAGLSRVIVSSVQNGANHDLTVAPPLPSAPATGVGIKVVRGCDKSMASCHDTYNNLLRAMAFPMTPRTGVMS